MADGRQTITREQIIEPVRRYWGYDALRPMQEEAIRAGIAQRDSLVVLPTGGGKSLCYQVPAVAVGRTDMVISPLISLMKDQVDGLRACGYPAGALHSGADAAERNRTVQDALAGRLRLVFVAPERLLTPWFMEFARRLDVRAFAIDEAHCISHWGHDFRPEYRKLAALKERFPSASVHAYTATATERVRRDICEQLNLTDPAVLVGDFDRPNLHYRILPRVDVHRQVLETVRRHDKQAVIVYCLSRQDTEEMAEALQDAGIKAAPYHAGLEPDVRRRTQDAFAAEEIDVVAATVAFGMGIDRSNVRCVIHATMPKSVEAYQQETGRAGRDGLEAECVLFYSAADAARWESLIRKSAATAADPGLLIESGLFLLNQMRRFATSLQCRHRTLVEHFGQRYPRPNCEACDVCLDELEGVEDGTVTAQKILSCVYRVGECFGVGHVADVLCGADVEAVRQRGHDRLSTFGLLRDTPKAIVANWIYQLVDQSLVDRTHGDRPVLKLNAGSWEVLRSQRSVKMLQTKKEPIKETRAAKDAWGGVDRGLFEHLRGLRKRLAQELKVPAYAVFSDATLRDMARRRPRSLDAFRQVQGVGDAKLAQFGARFVEAISRFRG
ncbi:MAG: DNA helicase RecQ [Phycisphaerales bacterium]|nr:MAG: DNA helicase RecQ [Phycisphaerales bacterium]